jgi:hypothetical protein
VSCYHTSGADSFVRSFWPVALFWIVALVYALWCSESGLSARDYVRRKVCLTCCTNHATEGEALAYDLQYMLDRQPERAAFLYRHAVFRARHRPRRRRERRWLWWRQSTPGVDGAEEQDENDGNLWTYQEALTLRTKVYEEERTVERPSPARQGSSSSFAAPTAMPPTRTAGWLPPQFRREQVTLEEMDDEMEHGVRCAICLAKLESGDVVGDIPCSHVFHKDCLKDWLKQKNRCPLCQQPGVARLAPYRPRRRNNTT